MTDLRKLAAMQNGKTASRKARSKAGTPSPGNSRPGSRGNSRVPSRAVSRHGSDDEDELSDTTQWSSNTLDDLNGEEDDELPEDAFIEIISNRIHEICDRKGKSVQAREDTLQWFNRDVARHYAEDVMKPRIEDLLPPLLKSIKSGTTERETVLALKAMSLVLVTVPKETIYDAVADTIKATIANASHPTAKAAAIHALSVVTFYGGATVEETEFVMDYFLEIVSSDGNEVDEPDNAAIVVAALEEWGFLATQLEDVEDITEDAMEAFVEQLESSDVGVQIAAGDNIALLFEKSYTEAEPDDDVDEIETDGGQRMVKRYTVFRNLHRLEQLLTELSKASSKRMSKKDRKSLHLQFKDVLNTVEKPTRGPRYSTALDEDGYEFGSRLKVKLHDGGKMVIDKWWKLHRFNGLKRLLQGGFNVHYEHNQVVFDTLPVLVEK